MSLAEFEQHSKSLRQRARDRQDEVRPRSHLDAYESDDDTGRALDDSEALQQVQDGQKVFIGDKRLANVRRLLARVDDRGFERSANQVKFHEAFLRASGRCIYKEEWEVHRRAIMKKNKWYSDCSEILVSTPRRFGKTFRYEPFSTMSRQARMITLLIRFTDPVCTVYSIAMFSASMALSFSTTIVVFSPSARGSRSLLERMHDFVRLLGAEKRVLSYNQENLRVRSLDGGVSLLRSFPSKIEVRCAARTHHIHTIYTPYTHQPKSREEKFFCRGIHQVRPLSGTSKHPLHLRKKPPTASNRARTGLFTPFSTACKCSRAFSCSTARPYRLACCR